MDYAAHYERLIARARGRVLTGYKERHHVLPKCMGGGNEPSNLVDLTPEEHYVAHQLLVKMHPSVNGLVLSAIRMARQCTSNKAYGWLRRRYAKWRTGRAATADTRVRMSLGQTGRKHKQETKDKIRAANLRNGNMPRMTDERRRELAAKTRGIKRAPFTAEHRAKIGASSKGRVFSAEARAKISAAVRSRIYTPEKEAARRAKIAASKRGVKRKPFKRSPHSAEHRAKISSAHKARHAALNAARALSHSSAGQ